MPFQNIISIGGNTVVVSALSVDAGPDIFAICVPDASLSATVVLEPSDLTVHTYLWEQVNGGPITWITPVNQLTASYTTLDFGDKTFRFTVDKNTTSELFDEVVVFGTPTATMPFSAGQSSQIETSCRSVTLSFLANATSIGSLELTTSYELNWTAPTCDETERLVEYLVQRKPALGPWITFDVVPAGDPRTTVTPNITDVFRVWVVYDDNENYASNLIYAPTSGKSGILLSDMVLSSDATSQVILYDVDDLSLITMSTVTNIGFSSDATSQVTLYTIDDLSLITMSTITNIGFGSGETSQVTFYEVDDLTGGNIGGP